MLLDQSLSAVLYCTGKNCVPPGGHITNDCLLTADRSTVLVEKTRRSLDHILVGGPCQTKTSWVPRARARARDSFCFAFTLRGRFFGFCLSAGLPSDVGPDWAPQQKIHRHIKYYDSWESFLYWAPHNKRYTTILNIMIHGSLSCRLFRFTFLEPFLLDFLQFEINKYCDWWETFL